MKRILFTSAILLVMNLSLFGQTENWNTLSKDNYKIDYPKEWELNESGQMGTRLMLFSPVSSADDKFRENVNLMVQDLTAYNLDLDGFVQISKDQIKVMITDSEILESKRISGPGLDHHKIVYKGKQGQFNFKFVQYYWVKDNNAYVLTLTCQEDQFRAYESIGYNILDSFRLL